MKDSSTGEQLDNTTGEEFFNTTGEEFFHQDKQNLKQNLKQGNSGAKKRKNKNQEAVDLFEHLWRLYPRKRGKSAVSDSKKGELLKIGRAELERCIERFKAEMEQEDRPVDKHPYGGTFFNGGFIDYLDENYKAPVDQGEGGLLHR